ncbi:MAG TPA: hypothetical protein VLJ79_05775 [Candidatus Binatia bacterium]|nr:hypothetical protein [Candidatus Binatia bacterium]
MIYTNVRLIFYCLALLGLCVYSALAGPQQITTVRAVQENSAWFHGRELRLNSQIRISQLLDDGFVIEQRRAKMHVRTLEKQGLTNMQNSLQVGDFVSLRGRWHSDGYLLLEDLHIQKIRLGRISLSSLTVLGLLVLFLYNTRLLKNA